MRKLLALAVAVAAVGSAPAQFTKKEPPYVAAVRQKLKTKVSVEFKDTPVREVVEELKRQVDNLSIWVNTRAGVSINQALTYQATDKPLDEVLDQMFKRVDLGYVIGREKDGRYKGWLIIVKGPYRGEDSEEEAAAKPVGKEAKTPAAPSRPKADAPAADPEKEAARKLSFAKNLIDSGRLEKARERLHDLVRMYPKTKAADEARELLEKLEK